MASYGDAIQGLRAQILENWRYSHPELANVVIITTVKVTESDYLEGCDDYLYEAIIAEDRGQGNRMFLKASSETNIEVALHELLALTHDLVGKVIQGTRVNFVDVESLNQASISTGFPRLKKSVIDARRKRASQADLN